MKLEYSQYYFIKAPGKQDSIFLLILMNKNLIFACSLPNVIYLQMECLLNLGK